MHVAGLLPEMSNEQLVPASLIAQETGIDSQLCARANWKG